MCLSPLIIKNPRFGTAKANNGTLRYLVVPCNHCPECYNKRRNYWSYRINKESENYPDYLLPFVSLDYAPSSLPYDIPTNAPTLLKSHLQKFIKSLRNSYKEFKFKYYAIGEYGETYGRPHYHILFFGLPNYLDFQKHWKYGKVDVGLVEPASIHYIAGYFLLINQFKDRKQPPFSLMSKNLGLSHYENHKNDYLRYFKNNIPVSIGKFKLSLPKYYKDKLKQENGIETNFQSPIPYITQNDLFIIKENYYKNKKKSPKLKTIKNG